MNTNESPVTEKYLRQLVLIEAYILMLSEDMKTKSNIQKIIFLNMMDFSVDDIAKIVGTTVGTVRKEISSKKAKRDTEDGKKNSD